MADDKINELFMQYKNTGDMAHTRGGEGDDAFVFPLTKDGLDQGGFTGTVGTDESNHLAAMDVEIHILQNFVAADFDGHIGNPQTAGVVAGFSVSDKAHPRASFKVSMLWYMASK